MSRSLGVLGVHFALVMGSGCAADDATALAAEAGDGDTTPWRASWRLVHSGPFATTAPDGTALIEQLTLGNARGFSDNFVNRGDVILTYDAAPGTIEIEMRPFAHADSLAAAEDLFDRLSLWAFAGSSDEPRPPNEMDPSARCGGLDVDGSPAAWQDDCAIYVFFDGDVQPVRTGADLRVALPPDYEGGVDIGTSDNDAFETYRGRGDVCVDGLAGRVDVELASGTVAVALEIDQPFPACPDADVQRCAAWDDPATPGLEPWDADCPCFAGSIEPARVGVETVEDAAASVTVDVPAGLWTAFRLENAGLQSLAGRHCPAAVGDVGVMEYDDSGNDPSKPWLRSGQANRPPGAPVSGARVDVRVDACDDVEVSPTPDAWDPAQPSEAVPRGDVSLCAGCLADLDCDARLGE